MTETEIYTIVLLRIQEVENLLASEKEIEKKEGRKKYLYVEDDVGKQQFLHRRRASTLNADQMFIFLIFPRFNIPDYE